MLKLAPLKIGIGKQVACPILDTSWPELLGMTENKISKFCKLGCSPICVAEFIQKYGPKYKLLNRRKK
jgi:hypothetical protein